MAQPAVPKSARYVFESGRLALDEQLRRIDSLDSKSGILLAADGIVAGLVLRPGSILAVAPQWVALIGGLAVLVSLIFSLLAFANRNFKLAPEPGMLASLAQAPEDWIKWRLIGNVLEAIDVNRTKLRFKARLLTVGQLSLLVALITTGAYFLGHLMQEA